LTDRSEFLSVSPYGRHKSTPINISNCNPTTAANKTNAKRYLRLVSARLSRGVDGFRIDAAAAVLAEDVLLRNEPPNPDFDEREPPPRASQTYLVTGDVLAYGRSYAGQRMS
jgi:hypothetical protein